MMLELVRLPASPQAVCSLVGSSLVERNLVMWDNPEQWLYLGPGPAGVVVEGWGSGNPDSEGQPDIQGNQ